VPVDAGKHKSTAPGGANERSTGSGRAPRPRLPAEQHFRRRVRGPGAGTLLAVDQDEPAQLSFGSTAHELPRFLHPIHRCVRSEARIEYASGRRASLKLRDPVRDGDHPEVLALRIAPELIRLNIVRRWLGAAHTRKLESPSRARRLREQQRLPSQSSDGAAAISEPAVHRLRRLTSRRLVWRTSARRVHAGAPSPYRPCRQRP
jgi:hypothetical protein